MLLAQELTASNVLPSTPVVTAAPSLTVVTPRASAPVKTPAWQPKFDRWVDLNTFNYGARYRSTFDSDGAHTFNQGQQRLIADGKFKFDDQGRYGIGFHLSSGRYFNWAYSNFIGGGQGQFINNAEAKMTPYDLYILNILPFTPGFYNSGGANLYLRQAFLTAKPISGVEVQFGGIGINRGVNTEATSYDDDGYMAGERLIVKRPKQLYFNELSYTRAYLGDLYTPNFFARGQRLAISNYWQILGEKDFGKRIAVSADYTYATPEGSPFALDVAPFSLKTTREAIYADTHESKVFDSARFEAYQRLNDGQYAPGFPFPAGKGFALTVSRHIKDRFSVEAGVADIDLQYITNLGLNVQAMVLGLTVNGDQYGVGKRYFVRPTIPLTKYLSLTANYSHLYDTSTGGQGDIWNAQALTAGFVFDAKKFFFHSPAVN
jgi:hypothetical protein